jgi:hypothetical protein
VKASDDIVKEEIVFLPPRERPAQVRVYGDESTWDFPSDVLENRNEGRPDGRFASGKKETERFVTVLLKVRNHLAKVLNVAIGTEILVIGPEVTRIAVRTFVIANIVHLPGNACELSFTGPDGH